MNDRSFQAQALRVEHALKSINNQKYNHISNLADEVKELTSNYVDVNQQQEFLDDLLVLITQED